MSEDEIIQYIEEHFDEVYKDCMKDCDGDEDIFVFQYMIKKFKKEMEQEKEKNKKLIEGNFREVADKNSYIKDMYISKDKIKPFVKAIESYANYILEDEGTYYKDLAELSHILERTLNGEISPKEEELCITYDPLG
ncbi:MAG: hypothetical protein IKE01_06540 [Clostridia bacterium]|nr:hypothetical protein [Clostridia bacterium]